MRVVLAEKRTGPIWHPRTCFVPSLVAFDTAPRGKGNSYRQPIADEPYIEALEQANRRAAKQATSAHRNRAHAARSHGLLLDLVADDSSNFWYERDVAYEEALHDIHRGIGQRAAEVVVRGPAATMVYEGVMRGIGLLASGGDNLGNLLQDVTYQYPSTDSRIITA